MRRVVAILALLAFGAAAQVGVAYGLVFVRQWEIFDDPWPQELLMDGWPGPVPREWVKSAEGIVVHPQRMFSNRSVAWEWESLRGRDDLMKLEMNVWRIGWPVRSLAAYRHVRVYPNVRQSTEVVKWRALWLQAWMNGYVQPPAKPGDPPRVWAMYPIWSGFALNTLIFAAVPAGMWWVGMRAKRTWRRRRGLCIHCGYELAGLAMCPECGVPSGQSNKAANGQSSK